MIDELEPEPCPDETKPRPRMSAAELSVAIERLEWTPNECGRRIQMGKKRVFRWLKGEEEIPFVVGDYLRCLEALILLKRLWEARHGTDAPQVTLVAGTLEELTGKTYPIHSHGRE
jgi:hypothetical protein